MSPKLPRVTGAQVLRALERDGWQVLRRRGSHAVLFHPTKPGRPVVPVHAGSIVPPGTLAGILKDCGLTSDELRGLL